MVLLTACNLSAVAVQAAAGPRAGMGLGASLFIGAPPGAARD